MVAGCQHRCCLQVSTLKGVINWDEAGQWNDNPVTINYLGIIEVEAVPAPPMAVLFAMAALGIVLRRRSIA